MRLPFRLSVVIAVLTVALMTLGGVVHAAGASLACPDWPLCYGQWFPEMVGGVALEHGHRLLASAVAALTVGLVFAAHRRRHVDRAVARLAWAALGLVLVQAVLGGITVLAQLSTWASTLHLAVSMLFLAVVIVLALRCSSVRPVFQVSGGPGRRIAGWVTGIGGLLFGQILLGGLVRHTGAAMACGRDPIGCAPLAWSEADLARLHVVHRLAGVALALLIPLVFAVLARAGDRMATRLAGAATGLVLMQIGLGVWSVAGALPVAAVALHLTVAAVLWALWVVLAWRAGILGDLRASVRIPSGVPSAETA